MTEHVQTHPLISIRATATVREAAQLMTDCSVSALGVLGSNREFVGLMTERDVTAFAARPDSDLFDMPVTEVANDFPVVIDGPIDDATALERMRDAHIRHLVVLEDDDLRIVSMRDFLTRRTEPTSARSIMTTPVVACRSDAYFEEVAEVLADRDISGMPVVDAEESVVGVISERDLAHALGGPMVRLAVRRHHGNPLDADLSDMPRETRRARDIMSRPPITVTSRTSIDEIAGLLRIHQINRVPVVDEGRLIGVVTRGDVLGAIGHVPHEEAGSTREPVLVGSSGLQ